jgi:hypothetical protein
MLGGTVGLGCIMAMVALLRTTGGTRRGRRGRGPRLGMAGRSTRLGIDARGALRVLRERILQFAYDRCFDRRGSGFHKLPHILELLKDGLTIDAKGLGEFIYALFCHSVSPKFLLTARTCAITLR